MKVVMNSMYCLFIWWFTQQALNLTKLQSYPSFHRYPAVSTSKTCIKNFVKSINNDKHYQKKLWHVQCMHKRACVGEGGGGWVHCSQSETTANNNMYTQNANRFLLLYTIFSTCKCVCVMLKRICSAKRRERRMDKMRHCTVKLPRNKVVVCTSQKNLI